MPALRLVHDRLPVLTDLFRAADRRPVRPRGRVRHVSRVLVTGVEQPVGATPTVRGIDLATGRAINLDADRVFVGAGGLGSTRIALNSLNAPPYQVPLQESVQFLVPFVSRRTTGDPRGQQDFTLNQFNLLLKYDDEAYTTSQVHCYPYNPAIAEALPSWLPPSWMAPYSAESPPGSDTCRPGGRPRCGSNWAPGTGMRCPTSRFGSCPTGVRRCFASVLRRLTALGPKLDLFPVLPMVRMSGPGKSYHFGSTFPHGNGSDLLGRIGEFRNVHLIDGSVLPSVPSTTFTLTVMANAHRIVSASRHV